MDSAANIIKQFTFCCSVVAPSPHLIRLASLSFRLLQPEEMMDGAIAADNLQNLMEILTVAQGDEFNTEG